MWNLVHNSCHDSGVRFNGIFEDEGVYFHYLPKVTTFVPKTLNTIDWRDQYYKLGIPKQVVIESNLF